KASEIGREVARLRADLVVSDDELKPRQQRALEEIVGAAVVDRSGVILDIFARHARSREGRIQVELAQLEYRLPRLTGKGKELSRLGGGIGTRGPGEQKLETDRQIIRKRIQDLRERLGDVAKQRERARGSRASEGLFLASLVGYTNAGKSTLMNALASADANVHGRMRVVAETLRSLELADRPRLLVFNQTDRLRGAEGGALREALAAEFPAAVFVSALRAEGLDALRERLASAARARWK